MKRNDLALNENSAARISYSVPNQFKEKHIYHPEAHLPASKKTNYTNMKRNYFLFITLLFFGFYLKAQVRPGNFGKNSSIGVSPEKIKADCKFFGGDTLDGFPLSVVIHEAITKYGMYTELLPYLRERQISYAKKKYSISKLSFEISDEKNHTLVPSVLAGICNNVDFENGNFGGWTGGIGYNASTHNPITVTAVGLPTLGINSAPTSCSYFTIMTGAGTDPFTGLPVVDPGGGTYACRLGGDRLNLNCDAYNPAAPNYPFYLGPAVSNCLSNTNSAANGDSNGETMQQTFAVTAGNCLFSYNYAVVMADAPHSGDSCNYFSVQVYDNAGTLLPCLNYFVETDTTGSGAIPPGFLVSPTFDALGNGVLYTPWTKNTINLQPYIGTNITIKFTAAGCKVGGHFTYAYIDCTCGPLELIVPSGEVCLGGTETLAGPANAGGTYSWSGPGIVSGAATATVTANAPGTYTLTVTNAKGCSYTIDTTIAFYPKPTVTVTSATACPGNASVLNASSTGSAGTLTYSWSPAGGLTVTNDSITSATVNATTSYTVTGSSVHSCTNTAVSTITVPPTPPPTFSAPPVCLGASTIINNTTGGGGTFNWNFGDGSAVVINQNSPTHTYTTSGVFVVTSTVNAGGCVGTNTANITVNANPTVTVNTGTMCAGAGPVNLTGNGAATYTWNTGATGATLAVSPAATTNFTVTGSTAAGCTNTAVSTVTVVPNPTLTPVGDIVCFGVTANLSSSSTVGGTTFSWAGANLVTTTGSNVTANPTTTSVYTVTGTANTCTGTAVATVIVTPNPTVTVTSSTICPGTTATIPATGATTYTWTGANLATTNGGTVTATPITTSDYTVVGTTASCTATAIGTVTVMPSPTVTVNNATICFGAGPVNLTANGAATYTWDTGATGAVLNVNPATTTNYTVTGSTGAGCPGIATTSVTVIPNPTITAVGNTICPNFNANLNANGATTYTWTGPSLTSNNASSVTANPGTTSSYTVIGTQNTCTATATATVTVLPTPTVMVSNQGPFCPGDPVAAPTFTLNPNDPATTIVWTNSNPAIGLPNSGGGIPPAFTSPVNNTLTTLTATISVTPTLNGCVGLPAPYTVIVKPTPFVNHLPNVEYCPNVNTLGINFTAIPAGPTNFDWINTNNAIGLSSSGIGNVPSFLTINNSNTIVVSTIHVVPTLNGCVGPDSTFVITINPYPNPGFTYSRACVGDPTAFTDESTIASGSIVAWNWDFNNDGIFLDATNQNPQTTLTPAGPHQIGLLVTSNKGCKKSTYENIYVNPPPVAALVGDNLAGCPVHQVLFTDLSASTAPSNIISWSWNFGNGQTSIAQSPTIVSYNNVSAYNPAYFNVSLTVKTDSGCTATVTKSNYITVYPQPHAGFGYTPSDVDILDPTVYFSNTSVGGSGNLPIHYFMGDVFIDHFDTANWSNLTNPIHTYNDQQDYTYNVTQWVQNIYGCKDSVTHPVKILPVYTFYIPNAFSPNGDGRNEGFKGTGIGIDPETYNLWVFDRWGNQCFHSTFLEETWNGTVNEKFVQEDVYVWKVRFKDMGGTKHELHGHVSIIK
jgi:gliding motility-associated-like protein